MYRLVLISLPHSLKSKVRLASYSIGRWGRPCGARTSDHAIAPSNGSRHYGGPYTTGGGGGDNIQSGPEGQVFPGIVTLVLDLQPQIKLGHTLKSPLNTYIYQ